jgi:hypothetical protein
MTTLFLILFIIGSVVLLILMLFGPSSPVSLSSLGMPSKCPRCGNVDENISSESVVSSYNLWYRSAPDGTYRCRYCHTRFRDHPNGTLIEDRDT